MAAISNFLFRHLTFLLLFRFYNPDTINLHVRMVLSIGEIVNAMLLPEILFSTSTLLCYISSGNNEQTPEEIEI